MEFWVERDELAGTFTPCLGETEQHQLLPDLHTQRKCSCSGFDTQLFLAFKKYSAHYRLKSPGVRLLNSIFKQVRDFAI